MIVLKEKRNRFLSISTFYLDDYHNNSTYSKKKLLIDSSYLNYIWNSWNNFWKYFFIAYIRGGYDLNDIYINAIYPNFDDSQCAYYSLILLNKRKKSNIGTQIAGTYQEPTWGDPKVISDLSNKLPNSYLNYVNNLLSTYQREISHFQLTRNKFIHLNSENINQLNTIRPYYYYSANQPIRDILNARSLASKKNTFDHWVHEMQGFLINL